MKKTLLSRDRTAVGKRCAQVLEQGKGNCLSRIQAMADARQRGAFKIAKYVLAHSREATDSTISQVAEKSGSSVATVSRFCTRMGYENYRSFQIDLAASLASAPSPASDIFTSSDKPENIIKRVFELNRRSLTDTEGLLNNEIMSRVAKLIITSRRTILFGSGSSGMAAKLGAVRFQGLGIMTLAVTDPYESLIAMSSVMREDVVIGISHTGRSALITKLMKLACERGARTVGITNYLNSPMAALPEFVLPTSFREHRVNAAVCYSGIAQMCILDTLYFLAAYYQGPKFERTALRVEEAAEKLLRPKGK
jgi:RpiR family transcriptional regulator, carbohydrate utilization regulator